MRFIKSRRIIGGMLLGVFFAFFPTATLRADDVILSAIDRLLNGIHSQKLVDLSIRGADWTPKLIEILQAIRTGYEDISGPAIILGAGFSGNRAGQESLYKINLDASFNKGVYPRAVRFESGISAQTRNNVVQESTTSLMLNLDQHLSPFLETYGFVDRFSDDYLSIKERYEIGGGLKWEHEFSHYKEKEVADINTDNMGPNSTGALSQFKKFLEKKIQGMKEGIPINNQEITELEALLPALDTVVKNRGKIATGLQKKYARLAVGFATTLLFELEQAQITSNILSLETGAKTAEDLLIPSQGQFRLVLRPSIEYRPFDFLTFRGRIYFKYLLSDSLKVDWRGDYRTDSFFNVDFNLKPFPGWDGKMSMGFEYKAFFDNNPPSVSPDMIRAYGEEKKMIEKTTANALHHVYAFKVKIEF